MFIKARTPARSARIVFIKALTRARSARIVFIFALVRGARLGFNFALVRARWIPSGELGADALVQEALEEIFPKVKSDPRP